MRAQNDERRTTIWSSAKSAPNGASACVVEPAFGGGGSDPVCAIAIRELHPRRMRRRLSASGETGLVDPSARVGTGSPAVVIASRMSRYGTAWLRPAGIADRKVDQGAMPEYIGHRNHE
jgi:hypothetical protein